MGPILDGWEGRSRAFPRLLFVQQDSLQNLASPMYRLTGP